MARDPLIAVLKVRRLLVDRARLAVFDCLAAEEDAATQIGALDEASRAMNKDAAAFPERHQFLGMTAMRHALDRARRQSLTEALTVRQGRTAEARAALAHARVSAEAVHQLVEEQAAASDLEAARREQHGLDEVARCSNASRKRANGDYN